MYRKIHYVSKFHIRSHNANFFLTFYKKCDILLESGVVLFSENFEKYKQGRSRHLGFYPASSLFGISPLLDYDRSVAGFYRKSRAEFNRARISVNELDIGQLKLDFCLQESTNVCVNVDIKRFSSFIVLE